MASKTRKLGLMPTLIVLLMVLGLAIFVGVILLMMLLQPGIEHSPEQSQLRTGRTIALVLQQQATFSYFRLSETKRDET